MTPEEKTALSNRKAAAWFAFAIVFVLGELTITALSLPMGINPLLMMLGGLPLAGLLGALFACVDPLRRFIVGAFGFVLQALIAVNS